MITLATRLRQKLFKKEATVLFVLLFALALPLAVAREPAAGKGINNVWVDVPLTQVFRDVSIETGVVIALCPHVPDPLISLDAGLGKPLEECLQELVAGRGLFVYPRSERFYLISDGAPGCPSFMEIAKSKRLYLKYITAKHLKSSLPRTVQQYVSSGERPNEALIYAVPEVTERIMEIVRKLDVPQPQVVLEVLVVELQEEASEEFGIDWSYTGRHNTLSMEHGLGAFTGIARYTSVPAREFATLLLTLEALVSERKASIRSRPRVATLNGQQASIEISLDEYFTIITDIYGSAGTLRTELEVIKSGVLLNMTPHIGDGGDITVDVLTEVSDVASRQNQIDENVSGDLPIIRRRKAETTVRVKQGDAIVIGGLIETQERSDDKAVPILSSIPLVGGLFKSKESTTVKKEVIIFITPRLIEEGQIALSDRHSLIDEQQETEQLRDVATLFDARYLHPRDSARLEKDIKDLQQVVALLEEQNQNRQDLLDADKEREILLSSRHNLLNVDEEVESLQGVIALLNIDEELESLRRDSP
jgi:Flp pilus assembly secretin CpaC